MSDLPGVLDVIANNTVSEVRLQPESLAVLLYALDKISNPKTWRDSFGEYMSDADIELIHELVDLAADDIMRPIVTIPVGATMTWHMASPPDRWLLCNGAQVLQADYPELFALWEDIHGAADAGYFRLLNMTEKSPFGHSGLLALNAVAGSLTHSLTLAEIPAHTHGLPRADGVAGGAIPRLSAANQGLSAATIPISNSAGSGNAHNILHPVRGVNWIVYAGLA